MVCSTAWAHGVHRSWTCSVCLAQRRLPLLRGLINLYAAIAILATLDLTPWQVTQCGIMMGIANNLVLEGGVLSSTGARGGVLTLCRILLAAVAGWLMMGLQALGVAG